MSESEKKIVTHSPGPWLIEPRERREHPLYVESAEGDRIAKCDGINVGDFVSPEACRANARLIAAAPDLLAACKAIAADDKNGRFGSPDFCTAINMVRAAIAKAERSPS